MPPAATDGNRAIFTRFQEEGLDDVEFYDSDVSEGELEDAIGEMKTVNELTSQSQSQKQRNQGLLPIHTIFVLDSSASMGNQDVDGKQRLAAVFDVCTAFVQQKLGETCTQVGDSYSLISFDEAAQIWFMRQAADEACAAIQEVRSNLLPAVHSTRFRAAFKKIAEVLDRSPKKYTEDARVVLLSDGAPHEGAHLGSLQCVACATGNVEGGGACSLCGRKALSRDVDKQPTAASLVLSLHQELLGSPAVCGIKQLVIYTVAFGAEAHLFEHFLRPLAESTNGTHHVSSLSELALERTFGTLASSITTSRTSMSAAPRATGDLHQQPFDSACSGNACHRICTISRAGQTAGQSRFNDPYVLTTKKSRAEAFIDRAPFAFGGMRLVYRMTDTYNKDIKMVAKRLIRTEHASQDDMLAFCKSTEVAIRYRTTFVKELRKLRREVSLFFVPCYLYAYQAPGGKQCCFVAENLLEGDFVKFNSNNGYVNEEHPNSEVLQAFSHYTFVKSKGKLLVVDMQGVVDSMCYLTDPQVVSRARQKKMFGPGDLGFEGMKAFFETHECGETCQALRLLDKQRRFQADMEKKKRECVICLDAPRSTKFTPCMHCCACEGCAAELLGKGEKCPVCRQEIEGYEKGNFSATFAPPKKEKPRQRAAAPSEGQDTLNATPANVQDLLLPARAPPQAPRPAPAPTPRRPRRPALNVNRRHNGIPFKVDMCSFWEEGTCTRGRQCTFAHGRHELRR